MSKLEFESSDVDPCLFIKRNKDSLTSVILYVDDILLTSPCDKLLTEVSTNLSKEIKIKDLGNPVEFLGIKIERDLQNKCIKLSQTKFIDKMLFRFAFDRCRPVNTPMKQSDVINDSRKEREEDEYTSKSIPNRLYREAVGSLLYLANATRPDISYAVNVLSRHQVNPTDFE